MLKFIFILLEVVVLFNLLIFVHELGHYLAARWRGLKIDRFAIWFGKPIWKTKWNGVEFCMGWIPAGGYVALPQMAPMEAVEGKGDTPKEELPPISALDKIIVAFAGPLFSFGLAFVFAILIWQIGRPISQSEKTRIVGYVEKGSPAEKEGIKSGDEIIAVDGKEVKKFIGMNDSIIWQIIRSEGTTIPVQIKRGNETLVVNPAPVIEPPKHWYQRKNLRKIGIYPLQPAIIGSVLKDSPADIAGLKVGDQIIEINGTEVRHPMAVLGQVADNPNATLKLTVKRGEETFVTEATPAIPIKAPEGEKRPMLGLSNWMPDPKSSLVYPGPWEQIRQSVENMVSTFSALLSPRSDIKAQHMGGAVKIVSTYYNLFESEQGWRLALWFSVVININLALLNLLPIPVLDGGHIVLAIMEAIRRKPISIRLLEYVQTGCAILLIGFMVYVTFFDVQDLSFKGFKKKAPQEVQFAPRN